MSVVYRAHDLHLGRIVALKMLRSDLTTLSGLQKRLETEAHAVSILNHPAIATLYDLETDGVRTFLVYEFVKGKTLRELHQERLFKLDELLSVFISIAEGMVAAHTAGIIHRDLKPENVMITDQGHVKVLDFGLAKLITNPYKTIAVGTNATGSGFMLGTVAYMSPEQIEGKSIDQRTDIFSFGTMLYELVSRRHPFIGENAGLTIGNILKEEPPDLSQLVRVPLELEHLISKCLRKKREARYQSLAEIVIDLKAIRQKFLGPGRELSTADHTDTEIAMSSNMARFLYVLIQCLYMSTYVAAIWYSGRIGDILEALFGWPAFMSGSAVGAAAAGLLGARAYMFFPVFLNLAAAAKLFRQVFPALLVLDAIWAASPLLIFHKIGGFSLVGMVLMALLPFAQRTLMRRAYPAGWTSTMSRLPQ